MQLTPCARGSSRLGVVAAALLAAVWVCACGAAPRELDQAQVERAVARSILNERRLRASVTCPSRVPQQAGHVFTCTAHLEAGVYPVTVTEIDGSGHVRYQDDKPLVVLNVARVQHAIAASIFTQRRLRATVSCPAEVLQQARLAFRCTAVVHGGSRRYPFEVSELDNAGHVRYVGT